MCKSVDQLLHAQHVSNLAQAIVCVQELARDHYAVVIALKWVILLVDMLESDTLDVRLASCNAIAAVSMVQEGRDAVRCSGGLRPLVMLLAEGSRSPVAAAAASALMNCSACDTCKEAIADCRGVPMLLGLIREAVARSNPAGSSPNAQGGGSKRDGGSAAQDLKSPGDCKAAVYAAGALMNMGGVISVQEKLMAAGAVTVFETVLRMAQPGDVVATRANFMLSWLAVASGASAGQSQKRSGGHHQHQQQSPQQPQDAPGSASSTPRSVVSQQSVGAHRSGPNTPRDVGSSAVPTQQPQQRMSSPAAAGGKSAGSAAGGAHRPAGRTTDSKPATPAAAGKAAVVAGNA